MVAHGVAKTRFELLTLLSGNAGWFLGFALLLGAGSCVTDDGPAVSDGPVLSDGRVEQGIRDGIVDEPLERLFFL
jgi:hypothetical protein